MTFSLTQFKRVEASFLCKFNLSGNPFSSSYKREKIEIENRSKISTRGKGISKLKIDEYEIHRGNDRSCVHSVLRSAYFHAVEDAIYVARRF